MARASRDAGDGGARLDFSYDEVVALCHLAAVPVPVGLVEDPLAELPEDVAALLLAAARRALLARSIVAVDGDSFLIHPAISELFSLLASPGLVVELARHAPGEPRVWTYVADPQMSVEHERRVGGVHRFHLFDTTRLIEALFERPDISATGSRQDRPVGTLDGRTWESVSASVSAGRPADALAAIGSRLGPDDAGRLVGALASGGAQWTLSVVHRSGTTVLEGGQLRWLADPEGELWVLPYGPDHIEPTRVVSESTLHHELMGYFPPELVAAEPPSRP